MNRKKIGAVASVLAIAAFSSGCGIGTTTNNDAGIKDRAHGKRNVYDMPDGYPNIATVCVRGILVAMPSNQNSAGFVVTGVDPYYCKGLDGTEPRPVR